MSKHEIPKEFRKAHAIGNHRIAAQQGDVLLIPVDGLPEHLTARADTVLARGEATGHAHVALGDDVAVLEAGSGPPGRLPPRLYLLAPQGARIVHEEHKEQVVPPGQYAIRIVREYDHFAEETRDVLD